MRMRSGHPICVVIDASNAADDSVEAVELLLLFRFRKERVGECIAGERFERAVAQSVLVRSTEIFVGHVDARDAGIVGRQHHRHAGRQIGRERMILAAHVEDHVAAGEADLDGDRAPAQFFKQAFDVAFESQRCAVPDPLRSADLDGLPDVEGEVGRRHQAEPQFAGMQRDRNIARQELHDLHLLGVIAPRDLIVLGLHEVERHDARRRRERAPPQTRSA